MNNKSIFRLIKRTFEEWSDDRASLHGAALSFYTVFSLSPLLVIVIASVGFFFGTDAVEGRIVEQIKGLVGKEGAVAIQGMIASARKQGSGALATGLALATLFIGATGVFVQLQDSLNTVWGVKPRPGRSIIGLIQSRVLSFAVVIGIGFLLLVSLVISAALAAVASWLGHLVPVNILMIGNLVASFIITTLLFAMMYKLLPDVEIAWKDVMVGAAVTSILFSLGKYLVSLYLGQSAVVSSYGAAGAVVVIFLWVYYAAQIVLLGAEFTEQYANMFGSGMRASAGAMPLRECPPATVVKTVIKRLPVPECPAPVGGPPAPLRPARRGGILGFSTGVAVGHYLAARKASRALKAQRAGRRARPPRSGLAWLLLGIVGRGLTRVS
jgi:membrane protein